MINKLGKHPAVYDPRTPKLKAFLLPSTLPTLPPAADWVTDIVPDADVTMLLNGPNTYAPAKAPDGLGCCVAAGFLNKRQNDSAASSDIMIATEADCLAVYMAQGGYVPGDPNTDGGIEMLSFLKAWQTTGLKLSNGSVHKIGAFVTVNLADPDERRMAMHLSGTLMSGIQVPQSFEDQFSAGDPITVVNGSPIEGGHCIVQAAFDATYDYGGCWAKKRFPIDPTFLLTYLDECYAIFDTELWIANNSCPAGIDGDKLLAYLKQLGN